VSTVPADWTLHAPDEAEQPKRFYGVTTGRVINLMDAMQLGRVQVQLPFIDACDLSPWARIAAPMSGPLCGVSFFPQIDDEVLVAFEQGDVNVPYIIGSLWNGLAPPLPNIPPDSPVRTSYSIRTLTGNQILMVEVPPGIEIVSLAALQRISMQVAGTSITSSNAVLITAGAATILVTTAGVHIAGAAIALESSSMLNLAAQNINITATEFCTIKGAKVFINP
jgi:uncharacterized protein involved in type VI secretion and phage assembly